MQEEHDNANIEPAVEEQDWVSGPSIVRTDKTFNIKNFYTFNEIESNNRRGQKFSRTAVSTLVTGAVYTIATTDFLIGVTSLSYAPNIGLPLPSLVGNGKTFIIKDEAGGAATTTITITSKGEKTIDGATSLTITTNYGVQRLYTDGANWFTK